MPAGIKKDDNFDLKLAVECATAFSESTELGCTVSDVEGNILHETGYGCGNCRICDVTGVGRSNCVRAHTYGMTEAERFGGKYIYFCPMGLTCFVSPILGQEGSTAKITVGPFLMVDREDYISSDLIDTIGLESEVLEAAKDAVADLPYVEPGKVNSLSILLFMAVGFMNNVSASARMLDTQSSDYIQGQVSEYILELKSGEELPPYPLDIERKLLDHISDSDKLEAQKHLNELLGHILFSSGGDFDRTKTRICELLVLISRATIDAGGPPEQTYRLIHDFFRKVQNTNNIDDLCYLLAGVMNRFIDSVFRFSDVKHVDVIHKAVRYMRDNYTQKLTLDDVARMVYLSPSYFSKIFKKEIGSNFNSYLNRLRIDRSKKLLLHEEIRLVDIAAAVGFEDQSYFTKVFKRIVGVSPNRYRETGGRI